MKLQKALSPPYKRMCSRANGRNMRTTVSGEKEEEAVKHVRIVKVQEDTTCVQWQLK